VSIDLISGKIRERLASAFEFSWRPELNESEINLVEIATAARVRSVAPFSNFMVGAALQTKDGKVSPL